ncbi:DNA (cytosine-5)-methyltransferase 1 [Rhodoblastus acidophilus]|uniref:DNA cytosine methyltransferase n=1 Tax=Rhodoblastus acidophilus TaxID=1074 RepID=UPI00222551AD|nr:DNA cytosine methyltransferase [Rhodoblastus acidophilus]MCW2283803.1 DNA (cytosine-5)-methyltransferase 1 [Rhodoblastus acidophilus]MCW2332848.1 DNA (cytosine-5)-methyltransferase 1 [Rhodoblastus acidophilus]
MAERSPLKRNQLIPAGYKTRKYLEQISEMPTAVSLFSGCGGSDAGLIKSGFEILMASDINDFAGKVYSKNMPEVDFVVSDIKKIKSFPRADLLVGCYPCQGFSNGGLREAERGINYLYQEFNRALQIIKPKAFIVENVSGMRRSNFIHLFDSQLKTFAESGYKVVWKVLDAREYGVPQERTRLFFVGIRSDLDVDYEFPNPTHALPGELSPLPPCPTIRDAIGDMDEWPEGEFDAQPFHWYYMSRNRYRGWNETSRTIVANSRHISLHPVSPPLKRITTDEWVFAHDGPARRFSYREAARLQGFYNDLKFPDEIGLKSRYRVVGNAVPPPLFAAVAGALPDIF